jgi:hypothetical protein
MRWPLPIALDHTVDQLARFLPVGIASAETRADLRRVAAQLPATLSNCIYFETPLGHDTPRVDLIVRAVRDAPGLAALAPSGFIWDRVRALAGAWRSPPGALHDTASAIWLEFDIEPGAAAGAPGVFVDFARPTWSLRDPRDRVALAEPALALLQPPHAMRRVSAVMHRCLDALPADGALASIGVLLPRGESTVRLCLQGLDASSLSSYLGAIGWEGSPGRLDAFTRTLAPADDTSAPCRGLLHVDIGDAVAPRIGIEYLFDRPSQTRGVLAERQFLDRLVELTLCTPARRDALMTWPGVGRASLAHELWPSRLARRVNHVKVMYEDARPPFAKAYLRGAHAFRARPPAARDAVGTHPSTQ